MGIFNAGVLFGDVYDFLLRILLQTAFFHRPKNQKSSDAIEGIRNFY